MKMKLLYACIALTIVATSCDNNEMDDTTHSADTAILVEDPANELQANPVNDTTVVDTTY